MRTSSQIAAEMLKRYPFLFRNSCGMAVNPKNGKKFRFGLMNGSSDWIGWSEVKITPYYTAAIFTSIEIKTANDKLSDKQRKWNRAVLKSGGICEVWTEDKLGNLKILSGKEVC